MTDPLTDVGRRLLLGARVAGAAQDRLLPAARSAARTSPTSTRWRSRPRSRTRSVAGIDIVSDGELRRDNDVDYFLARMPGRRDPREPAKAFYYDYYDAYVLPTRIPDDEPGPLGLVDDLRFTRAYTDRPVQFSLTGPFSLSRRLRKRGAYADSRRPGARPRPRAQRRGAARWPRPAPRAADRRAVPGRLPGARRAGGRGRQHRLRGRAGDAGAARLLRQPLRPPALGRPLRLPVPGRPRRRTSTSSCWSSPARATTTWRCSRSYGWDRVLGLGVIDVKTAEVEPVAARRAAHRAGAGRRAAASACS